MKKIYFLLMFLLMFSFVSAYKAHEQNTGLDVVFDEPNATSCNITYIEFPNNTKSDINQLMTKNFNTFNYTFTSGNFSDTGDVCVGVVCYDADATPEYAQGTFCRTVTPSGSDEIGAGSGMTLIGSLFVILLIAGFFFFLSMRLNNSFGKFSFLLLSSIMLVIAVFYSMVAVQQNLGGFENIISGYETFFFVLKIFVGVSLTAFLILALLMAIRFYKWKRGWID